MTLTTRVSVFFLTALGLALAGFSVTVWILARQQLYNEARNEAAALLGTLSTLVEHHGNSLEWEMKRRTVPIADKAAWSVEGDGRLIEVGTLRADTGAWIADECIIDANGNSIAEAGHYSRIVLRAAISPESIHATLGRLAATLAIASLGIWLVAALLGRRYCRRALQPLSDLTWACSTFTGEDPTHRLPLPISGDEIGELAVAFNGVLDRRQESFERQARFVAEASHQLRTPLTRLTGHLEVALRRDRPAEEYRKTLARALAQTGQMTGLVESLLQLARPEVDGLPLETVHVELAELVGEIVDSWKGHSRSVDLQWNSPQTACPAWVHPELLKQAIDNLIDNSFKYTPIGTPVRVSVGIGEISIQDRGQGIPPGERERLFQPFQRGDRPRVAGIAGVGLGLAICRRIVRSFGGEVTLEDTAMGCLFRVQLPKRE